MADSAPKIPSPPAVAFAGWLLPGLGYWLIGERARALYSGIAILALFVGSLLVAGIRTIDVPGYNHRGQRLMVGNGPNRQWVLVANPIKSILATPHFIPELFAGPVTLLSAYAANQVGGITRYVDLETGEPVTSGRVRVIATNEVVDAATGEVLGNATDVPASQLDGTVMGLSVYAKANPLLDAPAELGCAVAGGLNLLVLIDAAARAAKRRGV